MSYRLVLSKPAVRALRDLPANVNQRISIALDGLKEQPRPQGCIKLQGREGLWRIRVGDYRIIYAIDDTVQIIDVRRIGNRRDVTTADEERRQ